MKIRIFDLKQSKRRAEINMAPLIDMVFLLVIFFAVTTTFPENIGVQIDKPDASFKDPLPKKGITIGISSKGRYFYEGKEIALAEIREIIKQRILEDKNTGVIIMADKSSITKSVIDLMDEVKEAGAKSISIATEEEQKN